MAIFTNYFYVKFIFIFLSNYFLNFLRNKYHLIFDKKYLKNVNLEFAKKYNKHIKKL